MIEASLFQYIAVIVVVIALIWSSYVDLRTYILPDSMTAVVLLAGLVVAIFDPLFVTMTEGLIGAASGVIFSWVLREVIFRIQSKEPLGLGDVKLFGASGMWVGAEGVISVAFYGSLITILVVLIKWLVVRRGSFNDVVPFGPGIAAGLIMTILVGPIGPYFAAALS